MNERLITLREGDPPRPVRLPRPIADALTAAEVLQVGLTPEPGVYDIAAGTRIGVVSVEGHQFIIQPKIDINRLVFMMGYARKRQFWRTDLVDLDPASDLPEALAHAFVRLTGRALNQGLLTGYRTVEESLQVLRGRVREADQLRLRWGRPIPLEVRYDEYSVDIPENQVLLTAVQRLLRTPRVDAHHRPDLQRIRMQLADVTAPTSGQPLPHWTPSRLNARYVPALELAELILAGRSFEQRHGDLLLTGYLFNMATIFEDFVTVALRDALRPHEDRTAIQYNSHLDIEEHVSIRPDLVSFRGNRPHLVADPKYKAERPSGFPNADIYQMLAYCTALDLPIGHLIYAEGNEDARHHTVRHAGIRVVAHTLDLDLSPQELLDEVDAIARMILASAGERTPSGIGVQTLLKRAPLTIATPQFPHNTDEPNSSY